MAAINDATSRRGVFELPRSRYGLLTMQAVPEAAKRERAVSSAAIVALLVACLGEAVSFPLTRAFALRVSATASDQNGWFTSAWLLAARFTLAAVALLAVTRQKPTRDEIVQGTLIGGFAALGHLFQTDGLRFTEASTSAFLTQGYVVILPLLAAVETRRWPNRRVGLAVALNMMGLAVLARFDPASLRLGRGEAETLVAAGLFAGQIFCISRHRYRHNRVVPVTLAMFVVTAAASSMVTAASGSWADVVKLTQSSELWLLLGLLAVASTLLPFVLMNRYQRHVSAAEAGVIYGAEPVLASLLALFLPALLSPLVGITYGNEVLTPRLVLGAALILVSPLLLRAQI